MSFPPPLPNNPMFQAFAHGAVPPMPPFQIPLSGMVPLVPPGGLPMGVTVPAGVASISAPPVRNQNQAIIAAPPVISLGGPGGLLFPQGATLLPPAKTVPIDPSKKIFTVTVFVGNITDRASDMLIRQLLSKCGTVNNWKRVQGPNGKLQAFGFCEYCYPESAMRAIRLLHNFEIADKKLIVRVDAKTQEKLDEYRKSKNPNSSNQTESKNDNDSSQNAEVLDEATKDEDRIVKNQIYIVLKEHEIELSKDTTESKIVKRYTVPKDIKAENELNELDLEDEKRTLIHREIDKFRDTYKKYDEEKEEEKKKKEETDRKRSERSEKKPDDKRSRSKDRDDRRSRRSRERDRMRDRRPNRDRSSSSSGHTSDSDSPLDEEQKSIRRRKERLLRDKEASYQRRLRDWESREKRKAKEYDRDIQKETRRKEEEETEKQKLKQFLQDYDDDKHDSRYYVGKLFQRRVAERKKEVEQDSYEREQERKELEELKQKLAEEGHPDPDAEVRKRLNVKDANDINDRIKLLMSEARNNIAFLNDEDSRSSASNIGGTLVKTFGFTGMKIANTGGGPSSDVPVVSNGTTTVQIHDVSNDNSNHSLQLINDAKRKRLTVSEVFNSNEDDEASIQNGKKRRPPPNALLEDSNTDSNLSTGSNKAMTSSSSQISQEEKRRQIKNLIDKIPTDKGELFNYSIEWGLLDNTLMEKRIRPWINKKISDYIGEEEKTLLDFICNKLLNKSSAQSLFDDVSMVLDDEAQVFVVKLWRLLIYEIEAKKLGLNKER